MPQLLMLLALLAPQAAPTGPLSAGKWVVDLGRDYPLSPQAAPTDADAELTLLLMQAGARLEPNLAEAWLWQYELLSALRRGSEARQCLAEYLRCRPDDEAIQLLWLDLEIGTLQLAEARAQFCRNYLEREGLPGVVAGDLHRRIAEFHWNRAEREAAGREAEAALKADPLNVPALAILLDARGTADTPTGRLHRLLMSLRVNPGNAAAAQALGDELAMDGLPEAADTWYRHAVSLSELVPPGKPSVGLLIGRGEALIDARQTDEAGKVLTRAAETDPNEPAVYLAQARLAARRGDKEGGLTAIARAADAWSQIMGRPGARLDARLMGEHAWFMVRYQNTTEQARKLAESALERDESPAARRALGAALRELKELKRAEEVLTPAADADPWAAIELAMVQHASGDPESAVKRIRKLLEGPLTGDQRANARRLLKEWQLAETQTRPTSEPLLELVRDFPQDLLDFPLNPGKYIAVTIDPPGDIPPALPWICSFTLQNTSRWPVTLGPGRMVMPDLLCSVESRGDRPRATGPTIRVSLYRRVLLPPGELVRVDQTLSIGPFWAGMIGTPQVAHDVEATGVLNPMRLLTADGQEVFAPGIGGMLLKPSRFRRTSLQATPEELRELLQASAGAERDGRIVALQRLAMLMAERQHLAAGRLTYSARRIDPALVQRAILARAGDADWYVRAQLAECSRWLMLDREMTQAVTRLVSDSHWLVRGLAARSLADHYGAKFRPVLEKLSSVDPEPWGRAWAKALLRRAAASQPADEQPPPSASPGPASAPAAREAQPAPKIALPE